MWQAASTYFIVLLIRALSRLIGLPPATALDLVRERDHKTVMADGVTLLADSWYPKGNPDAPLILIRTPYGRGGLQGVMNSVLLAQYGFRVVAQSCRGTAGSGGEFEAFVDEVSDGSDTVAWLRAQPWFTGKFASYGASYVGYTQWAIAVNIRLSWWQ